MKMPALGTKVILLSALAAVSPLVAPAVRAAAPAVVVWDPEQSADMPRFSLDCGYHDRIAADLAAEGVNVRRATTAQIVGGALNELPAPDALLMQGGAIPEAMIGPCADFARHGGVLVCLGAPNGFEIKIRKEEGGFWRLSKETPNFAWQTRAVHDLYGMEFRWQTDMLWAGRKHTVTPLLSRYLPAAAGREIARKMSVRWFVPKDGGAFYPLIRSQLVSGEDYTPQVYVAAKGPCRMIFCASGFWTGGPDADAKAWPYGRQMAAALCALARDLRSGALDLSREKPVSPLTQVVKPPPVPQLPLDRWPMGSVEPEGATALRRWGVFNGSYRELDKQACGLPSHLKPGASATVSLEGLKLPESGVYLRVRVGFSNRGGAGLKVALGRQVLWNEIFAGSDAGVETAGNFGPKFEGVPFQVSRIFCVPREGLETERVLTLSNPGADELAFDALQLETRETSRSRSIGLDAFSGFPFDPELTKSWGHSRMRANTQLVKAPGEENRFADMTAYAIKQRLPGVPCQATLEGTPEWLAMSPERMEQARLSNRPKWVAPRPDEYAAVVEEFVRAHGSMFSAYEIWNEADISHFYRGSASEYATLFKKTYEAIRKVDPKVPIMPAGMANFRPDFIDTMSKSGVYDLASCVVMHPYCGQSPCWDLPYGQFEGYLYSRGVALEVYPHESGFTSSNFEWFKGPPDWTPERQAEALSIGMARILAGGAPRLTVFHAGGMNHAYGLIDEKGRPKPAYRVFEKYAALNGKGAVRMDASLVRKDGQPLTGVYVAGSRLGDGTSVFVVNPVQYRGKFPLVCELRYESAGRTVVKPVEFERQEIRVVR